MYVPSWVKTRFGLVKDINSIFVLYLENMFNIGLGSLIPFFLPPSSSVWFPFLNLGFQNKITTICRSKVILFEIWSFLVVPWILCLISSGSVRNRWREKGKISKVMPRTRFNYPADPPHPAEYPPLGLSKGASWLMRLGSEVSDDLFEVLHFCLASQPPRLLGSRLSDILKERNMPWKQTRFFGSLVDIQIQTYSSSSTLWHQTASKEENLPNGLIGADLPPLRLIDLRCIGELHGCVFVASLATSVEFSRISWEDMALMIYSDIHGGCTIFWDLLGDVGWMYWCEQLCSLWYCKFGSQPDWRFAVAFKHQTSSTSLTRACLKHHKKRGVNQTQWDSTDS